MRTMRLKSETVRIPMPWGTMRLIVLRPGKETGRKLPGILWIHGGGFVTGAPEMVYVSKGADAARRFGAVVVSPGYRLSKKAPYPAAAEDCWAALLWLNANKDKLGVGHIIIGGESAGGGLAAALAIMARDRGGVGIDFQTPLYPMLDCFETDSSRDNRTPFAWNTRRNRRAWELYLKGLPEGEAVPPYASPSREEDLSGLPPLYTFVAEGEPFRDETVEFVRRLREAGVRAEADVFPEKRHAFDMLSPWKRDSKRAKESFLAHFSGELERLEKEDKEKTIRRHD